MASGAAAAVYDLDGDFPATQFYGGTLDPDDPMLLATQAYGDELAIDPPAKLYEDPEPAEPDRVEFLGTQLYLDGMDNDNLDTLQYEDVGLELDVPEAASVPEAAGPVPELAATQAYPDFGPEMTDVPPREPVETLTEMAPPEVPSRPKKKQRLGSDGSECPELVATPVRSTTFTVLEVPDEDLPVRRRLNGKQPPPKPNPFVSVIGKTPKVPKTKAPPKISQRSLGRRRKANFVCTGLVLDAARRERLKRTLGIPVLESWSSKVTHVIAKEFKRTTKLMCGVCAGLPVVAPAYVDECLKAGELIDETPFLLQDQAAESSFATKRELKSFSLQASVQRARSERLLKGKSVYAVAELQLDANEKEELKLLVEAAGGRWLKRKPRKANAATCISKSIVLGQDFDPELLREAACTQVLRFDTYRL